IYSDLWKVATEKKNNQEGSYFSLVYQRNEASILDYAIEFLENDGFSVNSLIFDGLYVKNDGKVINFERLNAFIFEKTGFSNIKFIKKLPEPKDIYQVNLGPIGNIEAKVLEIEKPKYDEIYSETLLPDPKTPEDKDNTALVEYLNKYVFKTEIGKKYYSRTNINLEFEPTNFTLGCQDFGQKQFTIWKKSNEKKTPMDVEFNPVKSTVGYYNTYIKPESFQGEEPVILLNFIKRTICSNNDESYKKMMSWLGTLFKTKKTKVCPVLIGGKGIGKSHFMNFIGKLIGKDYAKPINDVDTLVSGINEILTQSILLKVEELSNVAGHYHKLQTVLKTLIDSDFHNIRALYTHHRTLPSYTNMIITSNNLNILEITSDNRRYFMLECSSEFQKKQGDTEEEIDFKYNYLDNVINYVDNHLPEIRWYFENLTIVPLYKFIEKTDIELQLIDAGFSKSKLFIMDLDLSGLSDEAPERNFEKIYTDFKRSCGDDNKICSEKMFSIELLANGYYKTCKQQYKKRRLYFVKKVDV
ncbi:MAG: primase-helicase family protein, partial [Nanoarchaeota archaeon]